MANNYNNDSQAKSQSELLAGTQRTAIPISPIGSVFRETTISLCNNLVDLLNNTFGIKEADHALMYPVTNDRGIVENFNVFIYFNTNGNYGGDRHVFRAGSRGNGNKYGDNGRINLMSFAGARTGTGGFELSDHFKKQLGSIAEKDNDGNIVIMQDETYQGVAIINFDFFGIIELLLGIQTGDSYGFEIASCEPINNGNRDAANYVLVMNKIIWRENNRKGRKSNIDYSISDMNRVRRMQNRRR